MQSTGNDSGQVEPDVCGNGLPTPNSYCFKFFDVPSVIAPSQAVSARFVDAGPPRFAVLGHPSVMLWWEVGELKTSIILPDVASSSGMHSIPADVQGTPAPDIVFTFPSGASVIPNNGGVLGPFVPTGLPDSAFTELGNTFPFDIGNDGVVEYLKGSGATLRIWRRVLDTWEPDQTGFSVPGCWYVTDLATGDFNGDALLDVTYIGSADTDHNPEGCAAPSAHGVAILLQTEVGQLQAMPTLSTGEHKYHRVSTGDLDGDGAADLAALTGSNQVLLFRSLGTGHFASPVALDAATYQLGDFDGDGVTECIVANIDGEISVADDVFGELSVTPLPVLSGFPMGVADLNEDGVDDIALIWLGVDVPTLALALSTP